MWWVPNGFLKKTQQWGETGICTFQIFRFHDRIFRFPAFQYFRVSHFLIVQILDVLELQPAVCMTVNRGMKWSLLDTSSPTQIANSKEAFESFLSAYPALSDAPDHKLLASFFANLWWHFNHLMRGSFDVCVCASYSGRLTPCSLIKKLRNLAKCVTRLSYHYYYCIS